MCIHIPTFHPGVHVENYSYLTNKNTGFILTVPFYLQRVENGDFNWLLPG